MNSSDTPNVFPSQLETDLKRLRNSRKSSRRAGKPSDACCGRSKIKNIRSKSPKKKNSVSNVSSEIDPIWDRSNPVVEEELSELDHEIDMVNMTHAANACSEEFDTANFHEEDIHGLEQLIQCDEESKLDVNLADILQNWRIAVFNTKFPNLSGVDHKQVRRRVPRGDIFSFFPT